jgi:pimeloyl-ACP methyl ester carboxylesterase
LLLLVHSPFVGPGTWRRVADLARAAGWPVAVPDLRPVLAGEPPLHERLAATAAAAAARAERVVVVPHSNAGRLTGAIVTALGERAAGAVLVDALLPAPGTRFVDRAPAALVQPLLARADARGLLPSWPLWWSDDQLAAELPDPAARAELIDEAVPVPVAYLEEAAPDGELPERCAYLRLSAGYDAAADQIAARGGIVRRRELGHLAAVTEPEAVAADVLALVDAVASASS